MTIKRKGTAFNVPYNTSRIYAVIADRYGTKIYIPANTRNQAKTSKKYFQEFLDKQPFKPINPPLNYA